MLGLAVFARLSLRSSDPLLRLRLLSDRLFRATMVTVGFALAAFLGVLYLTPVFLQEALHASPIASGTTTFIEAIGVAFASQTLGRLYPRYGPRVLAGCSGMAMAVVLALFVFIDAGTSLWWARALMFVSGMCNSGTILSVQTAMFTGISRDDTAHASAIYNTQRQTAIAVSVAMLTTIVAGVTGAGGSTLSAFHIAFLAAAALGAIGALAAWTLIRTDDARVTMQP